ncbi:MAG TPA: class I SAM-dependent methyltransferase [Bacillota bacterium]|nr:class I SAM-dependent methyltransferase [Bacillota bacterium]HOK68412.1 class I SAM-dependent methyltransferase [Bacillota bacterium]HPP85149.1 class I SAM-dependent methyltransferase [Bacillota bacterium]
MEDEVRTVREYYNNEVQNEWERLEKHFIEFELTKRFLNRYIKPGDRVLDVGGGPGRYSLYLAQKGCDVTLADLSEENVRFAQEKAKEEGVCIKAHQCDAREIDSIVDGLFDSILLMGPMYHLLEEADRVKCVEACLKLLKPGGVIFISFISSYAGIIYSMKYEPEMILVPELEYQYQLFAEDKPFAGNAFTKAYFIRHADVLPFMEQFGLEKLHLFGQESILAPNEPNIQAQPKEVIDKWLDIAERVCEREDLLSYSEHLMYIGRKRDTV